MMIYRMMAHLLGHCFAHPKMVDYREAVLNCMVSSLLNSDPVFVKNTQWKNVQIAIATVLLNLSALSVNLPAVGTVELKSSLLSTISSVLTSLQDEEALFRILAAVGTLISDEESQALARSLDLNLSIEHLRKVSGKVGECAKQVLAIF